MTQPAAPSPLSSPPSPAAKTARNPGPGWGFHFMLACDRVLPEAIFRRVRALGATVAVGLMPSQRGYSRDYLNVVLGRPARWLDVARHFIAFTESLMLNLRVMNGRPHRAVLGPGASEFLVYKENGGPALLGSFHLGHSDLIGFLLGSRHQQMIYMIRQRVANSADTDGLEKRFGEWVRIIWVNENTNLLFALKEAVAEGGSIALKCDRFEFTAKTEPFEFLGARRRFPFTIYHLALIFDLPVLFSYGLPGAEGETVIHASPLWRPDPSQSKNENLARGRLHFQALLHDVDQVLRTQPYLWFNFLPLNPPVPA